jgi:hypothetical protein
MTSSQQPMAGYTGVIISDSVVGYTGAEGYTGIISTPSYSGYTGSIPVPSSAADAGAEATPAATYNVLAPKESNAGTESVENLLAPKESNAGTESVEEASVIETVRESFNALTKEDARVTFLRNIAVQSPNLGAESNEAIGQIREQLSNATDLKRGAVILPWIVDLASKYRIPGVKFPFSLLLPKASPTGKIAEEAAPMVAQSVDNIALRRIRDTVTGILIRENELSPTEKNYWQNVATLLGIPH